MQRASASLQRAGRAWAVHSIRAALLPPPRPACSFKVSAPTHTHPTHITRLQLNWITGISTWMCPAVSCLWKPKLKCQLHQDHTIALNWPCHFFPSLQGKCLHAVMLVSTFFLVFLHSNHFKTAPHLQACTADLHIPKSDGHNSSRCFNSVGAFSTLLPSSTSWHTCSWHSSLLVFLLLLWLLAHCTHNKLAAFSPFLLCPF